MGNNSYLSSSTATKIASLIETINSLGKKAIILSTNLPYDAARFTNASAFVICYSPKGMSEDPRITDGNIKQYGPNIPAAIYLMYQSASNLDFSGQLPVEIRTLDTSNNYTTTILYNRGFGLKVKEE